MMHLPDAAPSAPWPTAPLFAMGRRVVVAGALVPFVLAVLGVTAWTTGALGLASFGAGYIPMAPSTAIGFLLVSAALVIVTSTVRATARRWAYAGALLLSLLAVIKLVEFLTGLSAFNLEAVLVPRPGEFGRFPLARMSPLTAAAFLLTGLSLASFARWSPDAGRSGGIVGSVVGLLGATVVLGYIYGAPLLYGGRIIPMALPTGLAFMSTGAALVALAGPAADPLRWFCGVSARARLLRVFLPLTVVAILVNGVLMHVILALVHANPALVAALFALGSAAVVGGAVSWVSQTLGDAIDRAEAALHQSREELEQRVRERTAELSGLNHELEAFSYSVSHDLRAPLRHVVGFARLLQEDAASQLTAKGNTHLMKVIAAAQRMGRLIDDLLGLSRTTRTVLDRQAVSLADLVRQARAETAAQSLGREVVWRVQESLPELKVDRGLFRLVLVNLLSNALKYTTRQPVAEIAIGTVDGSNDEIVFFVRDNGVGFDMQYADKLFGVFQRLHREDEFEGTGIGLANVRRIVQRHGGRVWAQAAVGHGATFYVALPNRDAVSEIARPAGRVPSIA